jgi:hypothetical protein
MNRKALLALLLPGIMAIFLIANASGSNPTAQAADDTPTPTPSPTVTPTPGPNSITLNPAQRALSCGTPTQVSVNAMQGTATAPNGTTITLVANPGTVQPTSVTTTNGAATFTYFAPAGAQGIATITASGLSTTGSVQISLFCGVGPGGGQVPGATINQPVVQCLGGTANAVFSWAPVANADVQYVDLSLANNGFAGGTFIGFGPLTGTTNSIQWNGLLPGQTHYWRVSAGVPGFGWVFSQTGSFTPCAPTAPAGGTTYSCSGGGRASVIWNIPSPGFIPLATYVDITIFDNGFAPGTFIGQPATGQQNFNWTGILANTTHYWRINHLGPSGWVSGGIGSFNAAC